VARLVAIIPARWASQRFPGKPLALIKGLPMIQHVYERAKSIPGLDLVQVATDNQEIFNTVLSFGGKALLTSPEHASGTDRLAEAARLLDLEATDIIINVQGDQPALNPNHGALLAQALIDEPNLSMATLAIPFTDPTEVSDPNHVKVVFGLDHLALYFSRAPIPYFREGTSNFYRHIGLYAYRAGFLWEFVKWPQGELEKIEKLEQLRALEHHKTIKVILAQGLSPEVDVPADLEKAEKAL
jgi:3-deoxy-manno-octulosonate cytidylyltransferase (CMP-KDO synthetase)